MLMQEEIDFLYSCKRGYTFTLPANMADDFIKYMKEHDFIFTINRHNGGIPYTDITLEVIPPRKED